MKSPGIPEPAIPHILMPLIESVACAKQKVRKWRSTYRQELEWETMGLDLQERQWPTDHIFK